MWELDHKEGWAPENWCFWTVVLGKTLESSLDCKEIEPVHPKGDDQSWVFIGRTDVEAETPILWPPDAKSWLVWKDPDAGKDWRREEKGMTEEEMVGWHHPLNGHGFGWTPGVGDGQGSLACCSSRSHKVHGDTTERLNWTHTHRGGIWSSIHFIAWYVLMKCERKVFLASSHIFGYFFFIFVDCRNYDVVMSRLFKQIFLKRTIMVSILRITRQHCLFPKLQRLECLKLQVSWNRGKIK